MLLLHQVSFTNCETVTVSIEYVLLPNKNNLVLEHFDEIALRTSELTDCAFADKELAVTWVCDARGWF